MATLNKSINLSLTPELTNPVTVFCSQYDAGETQITANIYLDNTYTTRASLSGLTAKIQGTKESKKGFSYDPVSVGSNSVIFLLEPQMTAEAGMTPTEIVFFRGESRIGTANFILMVEPAGLADDVDLSETDLPEYMEAGRQNAEAAAQSAADAASSVAAAGANADAAANSAQQAAASQAAAASSELSAAESANSAASDAESVAESVQILRDNAQAIADAADNAQSAAQNAQSATESAQSASESAQSAAADASRVSNAVQILEDNEQAIIDAGSNAQAAAASANAAKAWAVGPSAMETSGTDQNNSKYWADIAQQYAAQFTGGVVFRGSILFSEIPTTGMLNGEMYDVKDAFTTDSRFLEGAGVHCDAGTEIIWVEDERKWNILTPSGVTRFNGRQGIVVPQTGDYTAEMVGALKNVTGSEGQVIMFDENGEPKAGNVVTDLILPVNPSPEPTQSGAIWIVT